MSGSGFDEIKRGSRRNFFIVDNGIFEMDLGTMEKLVYICLLRYADNTTREAFPGQQRIASDCGLSRKRVSEAIRALEQAGLVEKQQRFDKSGSQKSNLYILYDANEIINRVCSQVTGGVTQGYRGCNSGLQEGVTQGYTNNTYLKILSEEEALLAKENIKSLKGKIIKELDNKKH